MSAAGAAIPPRAPAASRTAPGSSRTLLLASAPLIAVALALLAGAGFIAAIGEDPLSVYGLMLRETLGSGYGIGQTLFKATPLIFCGLSVAVGFRAGLFNIGAEGQLTVAAFAAAMAGAEFHNAPAVVLLPVVLAVAMVSGAAWGAVPGVLKARFGAHEVINTIMLNFIAFALVSYLGRGVFQPATVRTAEIGAGAMLPRLDAWWPALRGSPANLSLGLGLIACLAVGLLLFRTRLGFELRALGLNPAAAQYGGVPVGVTQVKAMAIAGALAGLAGMNFVLGYKHFFELGFSAGAGFMGIAVALLGRNHPAGVILAALFFGALSHGGLAISQRVPKELVDVLQAIVILLAICVQQVVERIARRMA
jgi:simple sugar transport system permease protein